MQDIVRHFIARRLGRGVIKTRITSDGGVSIELNFEIPDMEKQKIIVLVPPDFVRAFNLTGEALLYRLSRQAISQCQRQVLDAKLDNAPITLDCSILPWNGDLTMLPYTGATIGCSNRSPPQTKTKLRRRTLCNLLS
jgi:hypothetical protein